MMEEYVKPPDATDGFTFLQYSFQNTGQADHENGQKDADFTPAVVYRFRIAVFRAAQDALLVQSLVQRGAEKQDFHDDIHLHRKQENGGK